MVLSFRRIQTPDACGTLLHHHHRRRPEGATSLLSPPFRSHCHCHQHHHLHHDRPVRIRGQYILSSLSQSISGCHSARAVLIKVDLHRVSPVSSLSTLGRDRNTRVLALSLSKQEINPSFTLVVVVPAIPKLCVEMCDQLIFCGALIRNDLTEGERESELIMSFATNWFS